MKWLWLGLLALVTACEPEARRLLLVDFTQSDPLVLDATAAPWHDAGYRVEYRRFYPHLTRQDLARYRTIILLGGREPERVSDALTIGDLALLTEWVRRDGVVVLGYTTDRTGAGGGRTEAGTLDRWIMNQWLGSQGSGIVIGTDAIDAPAVPLPHSPLDEAGFEPFAAGRNHPLAVRNRSQTLAHAGANALVAASRLRDGLIVVTSRDLLGSTAKDTRTRDFLIALARWTRRPAEWAAVDEARSPARLQLAGAPRPVRVHPPPLAPPPGAATTILPQPVTPDRADRPVVPSWIARQGLRVLWTRFMPQAFEGDLQFAEVAALNTMATVIPVAALADTGGGGGPRNIWRSAADRLQTTSLRWMPGIRLVDFTSQGADEVDRHGDLTTVACGLDSVFWRGTARSTYRTLARLGGARPDLLAGISLDLDSAMAVYSVSGFCDADYRVGLAGLALDRDVADRLAALPPPQRYDSLLERGLLDRYFEILEAAVAERALTVRVDLRRLHPDLRYAFRAGDAAPADWFSLGLLRGFSSRDAPALLWLRERDVRDLLERYRERGIYALSAVALDVDRTPPADWTRLRPLVFGEHAGFWLDRVASDSAARLIRRLVK